MDKPKARSVKTKDGKFLMVDQNDYTIQDIKCEDNYLEEKESELKQWHPVFVSSIKIALKDAKDEVEIQNEVSLSSKPLKIDVLVVKNISEAKYKNSITHIFKTWNIIEFKSPSDRLEPTDFDYAVAYARLHQAIENREEELLERYTITLFSSGYPREMFKRILKRGLTIEKGYPIKGIYKIIGEMYDMQVVVINELEDEEVVYPFAPFVSRKRGEKKAFLRLIKEQLKDPDNIDIKHVTNFSITNGVVSSEELKEVAEMIGNLNEIEKKKYIIALKGTWLENEIKAEGKTEGKEEDALNFLRLGVKDEIVAQGTGLSIEKVIELKNKFIATASETSSK